MITQGLFWWYFRCQSGGHLGPSLWVTWGHFRGILENILEVLWGQIGRTMDVTFGYFRVISRQCFIQPKVLGSLEKIAKTNVEKIAK